MPEEDPLERLSATQRTLVAAMATAMRDGRVEIAVADDSDLVTPEFADAVANFLLLHHAVYGSSLNKEAFEFIFTVANQAAGREAERNRQRGSNTHDVRVEGTKWSLKTEAGTDTKPQRVYIAKWMEARWIRECTNPAECAAAMSRIVHHGSDYERIAALQAIRAAAGTSTRYRLIELPKGEVNRLLELNHRHFTKPGSKKSYGANLPRDASTNALVESPSERTLRVLLDSSVEKVRMWFEVDACKVHGEWLVEHAPLVEEED